MMEEFLTLSGIIFCALIIFSLVYKVLIWIDNRTAYLAQDKMDEFIQDPKFISTIRCIANQQIEKYDEEHFKAYHRSGKK